MKSNHVTQRDNYQDADEQTKAVLENAMTLNFWGSHQKGRLRDESFSTILASTKRSLPNTKPSLTASPFWRVPH